VRRAVIAFIALAVSLPVHAKDLSGQWGAGFSKALGPEGSGVSSLAVRYWVDRQLALEGLGGFRVVDRNTGDERFFTLGGRFLIKAVEEENLHVYGGAGLAWLYRKEGGDGNAGVGAEAFAGVEYFFQGLPHLGFSAEAGLSLQDVGDETAFGTWGESFVNLGLRYYF